MVILLLNAPKDVTAKTPEPIPPEAFRPISHTAVYWLGGAGFLLNCRGAILLIDPVLLTSPEDPSVSEIGLPLKISYPIHPEAFPRLDAVLYTHPDIDHLGPQTALALARHLPQFWGPHTVLERLTRLGIRHEQIHVCRIRETFSVCALDICCTPADHPWQLQNPAVCGKPYRMGDCCGFLLHTPDGRLFFPGDTRLMEEHLGYSAIDLLALDVSVCDYHLRHKAAAVLADTYAEAHLIPMHYGTYRAPDKDAHLGDPADVLAHVSHAEKRGHILAPGQPFHLRETNRGAPEVCSRRTGDQIT